MGEVSTVEMRKPRRWDQPFDPEMSDEQLNWLAKLRPFVQMDPATFPAATPLKGILRNDCRIRNVSPGEVIVREGDYGSSAFLVLSGSVRAALNQIPPQQLGQSQEGRKNWWSALSALWKQPTYAEVRNQDDITPEETSRVQQGMEGTAAIFLQDFDAILTPGESMQIGAGELFGEVAAMYRSPRTATVVADSDAKLLEIRWQGLRLLRRDRALAEQLEQNYRSNWLLVHLRETPLFRFLSDDSLQRVAEATTLRSYGRLEWHSEYRRTRKLPPAEQIEAEPLVALEGHLPTDLLLIRSGFARVCCRHGEGHRTLGYLGKGHMFGLREIVHNAFRSSNQPPQTLQESLRAVGFVDTLHIPIEVVAEHVLPFVRRSELPGPVTAGPAEEIDHSDSSGIATGMLEFIVQERLNNGRRAMVIDLNACTRCDDCVKACATTHGGNPRFTRSGPVSDGIQFTQACMHCADPVCMIGCPTGAISRHSELGTVSVHEKICIGCGTCAASCPYENIQMKPVRDPQGRGFFDSDSGLPIMKATKCDFCQTQPAGPACQAACPHDALVRIDLADLDGFGKWLGRRK